MAKLVATGFCVAVVGLLSGCGSSGPKAAKICCAQCGEQGDSQSLVCHTPTLDDTTTDPTCKMDEVLAGVDDDLRKFCTAEDSHSNMWEKMGSNDSNIAQQYVPAAAKFWQSGKQAVSDRADAWTHAVDQPDLKMAFGENWKLSGKEIVVNHRNNLARQGLSISMHGELFHPLDEKLGSLMDFVGKILDIIKTLVAKAFEHCTSDAAIALECLKTIGLVALGQPQYQTGIFVVQNKSILNSTMRLV